MNYSTLIGGTFRGHKYQIVERGETVTASVNDIALWPSAKVHAFKNAAAAKLAIRVHIDDLCRLNKYSNIKRVLKPLIANKNEEVFMAKSKRSNNNPNQLSFPTDIEVTSALVTIAKALGKDVTQLFAPMFNKTGVAIGLGKQRDIEVISRITPKQRAAGMFKAKAKAKRKMPVEQLKALAKAREAYFKKMRYGKFARKTKSA